jgi:SAM-dependent methyltransferase
LSIRGGIPRRLDAEFAALGRWITRFAIDGTEYGGSYDALGDPRLDLFFRCFPNVRSILELGSLEGGHTLGLAARPDVERVLGVEGRPENVRKAEFVRDLLGATNVAFVTADLETAHLSDLGRFDAVFCVGLLYHLPAPWALLSEVARVSDRLFLWTHLAEEAQASDVIAGYRGTTYREAGLEDPLSGLSPTSFWPTRASLIEMLGRSGFRKVQVIEADPAHPHGSCLTLAATQS